MPDLTGAIIYAESNNCRDFAEDLADTLTSIGWTVKVAPAQWREPDGITITANDGLAVTVFNALEAAMGSSLGIACKNATPDNGDILIRVADKPNRKS